MSSAEEKPTTLRQDDISRSKSINSVGNIVSPWQPETSAIISSDVLDTEKELDGVQRENQGNPQSEGPFSVFSKAQKRFIVFIAALTTLMPPLTASIYYPVITMLAEDLNVSTTDINLTITTYLVCTSKYHGR